MTFGLHEKAYGCWFSTYYWGSIMWLIPVNVREASCTHPLGHQSIQLYLIPNLSDANLIKGWIIKFNQGDFMINRFETWQHHLILGWYVICTGRFLHLCTCIHVAWRKEVAYSRLASVWHLAHYHNRLFSASISLVPYSLPQSSILS